MSDTVRLVCPVTGAFCGLVRIKKYALHDGIHRGGLYTVIAETPILNWLSTGENGEYPMRMPYEVGHVFNAEGIELQEVPPGALRN